jgi:hypothetical protein
MQPATADFDTDAGWIGSYDGTSGLLDAASPHAQRMTLGAKALVHEQLSSMSTVTAASALAASNNDNHTSDRSPDRFASAPPRPSLPVSQSMETNNAPIVQWTSTVQILHSKLLELVEPKMQVW